ncbi:MAG TPA: hypothetical protein PLT04_01285 [Candidatus Saccharibacteria bacterium]|nr:hypothetical protein [Candidatus Saccharibacteria bacterium]
MIQKGFFQDLKQYITAENRALEMCLEKSLDEKLDQKIDEKLAPIKRQINDLAEWVQGAMATASDARQAQIDDHEARITRLEAKLA